MNRRLEIPGPAQQFVIAEREIPEPPANGAVVKTHFAGICHSDLHLFEDKVDLGEGKAFVYSVNMKFKYPSVLGHEIAGEIYSFGKDVNPDKLGLHIGDLVMVYPWSGCRNCSMCNDKTYTNCPKLFSDCLGLQRPGGFQQYVEVPHIDWLIPAPDGLPMDTAALIPCSGITAYNAMLKARGSVQAHFAQAGEGSLLIVGAGGLGLWGIQIAKEIMPPGTKIIVAEAFESKFEDARKAGADETILWPVDGTVEANVEACKKVAPEGVSGAVDFVGAGVTTSSIFECLAPIATMVVVGLLGGQMRVSTPFFCVKQPTIRGTAVGEPEHVRQMAQLVVGKKVTPPPITHVKLEDAGKVLEDMQTGKTRGRNVIKHIN